MDISAIPNHHLPLSEDTCMEIITKLKSADSDHLQRAGSVFFTRIFKLDYFYGNLATNVGIPCRMARRPEEVLTAGDKKILRDFAKLDERIAQLYAEWKRQNPVIARAIGIP
ncbi:hypothetical protein [Shimazuella alba]|uniref:Uncharacterized protein n=1 Tax=Shimazuella alba TaxID=2690964 RepID=A0A6I4VNP5_9BACL|nr:hypothetical protein [Shimazuella alba]MXQ53249.1 hypothetical protein [Shimazuella alba]